MNEPNQSALLARAAGRASERPDYLGWVLGRYAEAEQKTETDLADMLKVSALDYNRLRLCLRPRARSFAQDVQQLAGKFGSVVGELAKVIRYVEALEGMKEGSATVAVGDAGLLMAARARSKGAKSKKKGKAHDHRTEP